MKRVFTLLLSIFIIAISQIPAFADGDPNMEGGGGGIGDGSSENRWSAGDDGVRVSVVKLNNMASVTVPIDYSNKTPSFKYFFGHKNKLNYRNGASLQPIDFSEYNCIRPETPMPSIVSASGATNIQAVKTYFSREGTLRDICDKTGFDFEELLTGEYVVLLEPLVYLTYGGINFAMTATEAALYDQLVGGALKSKMGFLTHQNLPLAMFLERPDLGFPAYSGATSGIRSNSEIISSLGLGTVRFSENGEGPEPPPTYDYEYRTNTDVITAVTVRAGNKGISPDDNGRVTFYIEGSSYSKTFVCAPDETQLVWVRWRTPSTPKTVNISVSTSRGSLSKSTIKCNVTELQEITPPDPQGRDRNDGFMLPSTPNTGSKQSLSWGEWWAWWQENWVWESDNEWIPGDGENPGYWEDNGEWVDKGWWEYEWKGYSASFTASTKVAPDAHCPTAMNIGYGWEIKSGYGISVEINGTVGTSGGPSSYDVTGIQNAVATFSEFGFSSFNRVLEPDDGDRDKSVRYVFKRNPYSQWNSRVHFTPIWYPDNTKYVVATNIFDVWTPAGQLYVSGSDDIAIDGNVYDDWHIRPIK